MARASNASILPVPAKTTGSPARGRGKRRRHRFACGEHSLCGRSDGLTKAMQPTSMEIVPFPIALALICSSVASFQKVSRENDSM